MELNKQYLAKIRFREDTAENWKISNPILSSSEPGREVDTGIVKVGDGKTAWLDLKHINASKLIFNFQMEDKEFEATVATAMEKYMEDVLLLMETLQVEQK